MSDTSGSSVGVSFYADPESEARLTKVIGDAVASGFEKGMDRLGQILSRNAGMIAAWKKIEQAAKRAFDPKLFAEFTHGMTDAEKASARLIKGLKGLDATEKQILAAQLDSLTRFSKAAIRTRELELANERIKLKTKQGLEARATVEHQANVNRQLAVDKGAVTERLQAQRAALDATGRAERQAAQESVIAARVAGQQRVAITRAVLDQIQRLERGAASLLKGVGRGVGGIVGAGARGAGSGIANLFRREASEVSQGNRVLERGLRERESVFRTSFRRQETLLRETVSRQSRSVEKLRTIGSHGIAGAVTGRGVGGGLGLAGLGAGIGVGALLTQGFRDATNYTEQLSKTRIVFKDFSDGIVAFSEHAVNALGSTKAEALQALSGFGALFHGFDIGEKQAAFMSVAFTQLATDMASFSNTTVDEAVTALNAGLVGENEPLKRFGVVLNDAVLKAKALELGLYDGKGALDANAKAQAAFALIMEKTQIQQGNFALTADEGANAQKRFGSAARQTFSDLAGLIKGVATQALLVAIPVFTTISDLITGKNLSADLNTLRDALKGVGIALGVLIAAKAGVEILGTLGTLAKLAFTPVGALVTIALGLGAAIGILLPRSEAFREGLGDLVDKAKELGGKIKDFAQPIIEGFINWITETALPAIGDFAMWVGEHLVSAFHATVNFVKSTVIPILKEFGNWITGTAVPAVVNFGKMLVHWFGVGLDKVIEFWDFVKPFLQPAIDGFLQLGSAIASVFTDFDFSKIVDGLKAAASGIFETLGTGGLIGGGVGGVLGGLVGGPIGAALGAALGIAIAKAGPVILDALRPIGQKVLDFLGGVFTAENFARLAGGVLDFVEFIGYQIGSHADIIIKALAAVVAAAAIIAFRFAVGFVKGLAESLPRLLKEIGGLIADNLGTALLIGVGLIGAKVLFSAFKSIGQMAGKAIATGVAEVQGLMASRIGQTIKKAMTAATIGAVGFVAGRAEGAAGGSGAASALGAGLTTLAATKSPLLAGITTAVSLIGSEMGKADRAAEIFKGRVEGLADALKQDLAAALEAGATGVFDFNTALSGGTEGGVAQKIRDTLDPRTLETLYSAGIGLSQVLAAFKGGDAAVEALLGSFTYLGSSDLDAQFSDQASAGRDLLSVYLALKKAADDLAFAQQFTTGGAGPTGSKGRGFQPGRPGLSGVSSPFGGLGLQIRDVLPEKIKIPSIDVSALRGAIIDVNADLDAANTKLQYYLELVKQAFGGGAEADFGKLQHQAIVTTADVVADIGKLDISTVVGAAGEALKEGHLEDVVSDFIADGIGTGAIHSLEGLGEALYPVLQAALESIDPTLPPEKQQEIRDTIIRIFTEGLEDPAIPAAIVASRDVVSATFAVAYEGFPAELQLLGVAGVDGLTAGFGDTSAIARMAAAAQALVDTTVRILGGVKGFQVGSPSKVTTQIGRWVGEGLAIGLEDSTANVGSIISGAIDRAVEQAQNAADRGRDALQGVFGEIFGANTAGESTSGALAGITSGMQSFLASFDSTVSKVFELAEKLQKGESLSAADRDILGESAFSLNASDVLGVGNIGAFVQALDAIKEFGKVLLAQGQTPQYVSDAVRLYVQQLTDQAKALGFSSDEVDQLVANLGLSNDALASFVAAAEAAAAGVNTAVETIFDVVKKAAAAAAIGSALTPDDYIKDLVASIPEEFRALLKGLSHADLVKALAAGALGDLGGLDPEIVARFIEASYGGGFGAPVYPATPEGGPTPDGGGNPDVPPLASLGRSGSHIINIYPPHGDPYAIGLQAANAVAAAASLPGG